MWRGVIVLKMAALSLCVFEVSLGSKKAHARWRLYHVGHDVVGKSKLSYIGDSRVHRQEPKDDRKHPLLEALASIMTGLLLEAAGWVLTSPGPPRPQA